MAASLISDDNRAGHVGLFAADDDWSREYSHFRFGELIEISQECAQVMRHYGMPGGKMDRENGIHPQATTQPGPYMRHLIFIFESSRLIKRRGTRHEELRSMHHIVNAAILSCLNTYLRDRWGPSPPTGDELIKEADVPAMLAKPVLLFENVFFSGVGAENASDEQQSTQYGETYTFNIFTTPQLTSLPPGLNVVIFAVVQYRPEEVDKAVGGGKRFRSLDELKASADFLCDPANAYIQLYPGVILAGEESLSDYYSVCTSMPKPKYLSDTQHVHVPIQIIGLTTQDTGFTPTDLIRRYVNGEFDRPWIQQSAEAPHDRRTMLRACQVNMMPGSLIRLVPMDRIQWAAGSS